MQKFAPQGIVAQQFAHREIANAVTGDVVGLVGSMTVDSVNFTGAPIGRIATISQDRLSFVVVELFASMIVEQVAGTGGVTAGDWLKSAQNAGAAAAITTLATDQATLVTALATQATAQATYNAALAASTADPTPTKVAATVTANTALQTAIAATQVAQAAVNADLANLNGLALADNTVVTAAPVTTAADLPLIWGRALNTVAANGIVYVLPV